MVFNLIDSDVDLMATASGVSTVNSGIPRQYEEFYSTSENSWLNNYLEGAYAKRVQDLEQFARDKTLDFIAKNPEVSLKLIYCKNR